MRKWLFFDLGYTLINEDDAHKARIEACLNREKQSGNIFNYDQIYNQMCLAAKEYRPQFYGAMSDLGISEKTPYPGKFEKVYPSAVDVLSKLKKKYHIGIIANQSPGVKERLKNFGLLPFIELIISSAEEGISKPDLGIFALALRKAGCSPSDAYMIGDRLDNDIYPAKKSGMKTIWIKQGFGGMMRPKSEEYIPDTEISELDELLDIL